MSKTYDSWKEIKGKNMNIYSYWYSLTYKTFLNMTAGLTYALQNVHFNYAERVFKTFWREISRHTLVFSDPIYTSCCLCIFYGITNSDIAFTL